MVTIIRKFQKNLEKWGQQWVHTKVSVATSNKFMTNRNLKNTQILQIKQN